AARALQSRQLMEHAGRVEVVARGIEEKEDHCGRSRSHEHHVQTRASPLHRFDHRNPCWLMMPMPTRANQITDATSPPATPSQHHIFAFFDDCCAPAMSPAASFVLTCAA